MLYNVLIVEDDRQMAQSLAAQIGVLGHTVVIAYGPRMAIQQLNQVIPDVIFMDLNMPGLNGLEVLRFLRRDPTTATVPVVIVSASDGPETISAALKAGANDYIVKPPTIEAIEQALARVVTLPPELGGPAQPLDERASAPH
ncbi:MAG: response regulator [Anaerolineae bacterium]|nr:response regulator [Anaerolineae bacterium]MEB2287067.1 response regulator [Anaerolineae bacterium]